MNSRLQSLHRLLLAAIPGCFVAASGLLAQAPIQGAPRPMTHPADALSIFSDAYPNVPGVLYSTVWDLADLAVETLGDGTVLRYSIQHGGGFVAMEMPAPGLDATAVTHVHLDVWTPVGAPGGFAVKLVDFGPNGVFGDGSPIQPNWPGDDQEAAVQINFLAPGAWTSIDIPLTDFVFAGTGQPITRASIVHFILESAGSNVFVDNVYFYRESTPKPNVDIYVANTRTGQVRQVTSTFDSDEYNAAVSNDGKTLVYDVVTVQPFYTHRLFTMDLETGVSAPLPYGDGGNDARFSPNSRFLVFDRAGYGDQTLYLASLRGRNAGTVTVLRTNAVNADWSNNSRRIVFQDTTDGSLRTIDVESGAEVVVAPAGESPAWSPNGESIAFVRFNPEVSGTALFVVEVRRDGRPLGAPVQLTPWTANAFPGNPTWSNNSRRIVYQANPGLGDWDYGLWTVPVCGGTPSLLLGSPDKAEFDPAFSNNGRFLFYSTQTVP